MRFVIAIVLLLLLGIVASWFFQQQSAISVDHHEPAASELEVDVAPVLSSPLDPVLEMARDSLARMQASVYDYTTLFEKQERVDGKLADPQTMEIKILCGERTGGSVKPLPMHAYLRFMEPSKGAGREIIWVDGRNDGKLIAHEAGFMNLIRVHLDPKGSLAMAGGNHSIDQIGLENLLKKLIERGEKARNVKDCVVEIQSDFARNDKKYTRILVTNPTKSQNVDFYQAEILFDPELKLPVGYSAYLWPAKEGDELPLEERYAYRNLKVNVGLTEEDFNPDNPAYNFP
jgi:hypothetical protein